MAGLPFRVVVWERIDDAVEAAVLTTGKARHAIQSMIDLAVQGGGGGGLSGAAKTELVAVRRRTAPGRVAGKAIAFKRGMGWHEVARTDHLVWLDDAERKDGGQDQADQDQEGAPHFHPQNRNIVRT